MIVDGLAYEEYIFIKPLSLESLKEIFEEEMREYSDLYMMLDTCLFKISSDKEWVYSILFLDTKECCGLPGLNKSVGKYIWNEQMEKMRHILHHMPAFIVSSEDTSYLSYKITKRKMKTECNNFKKNLLENKIRE